MFGWTPQEWGYPVTVPYRRHWFAITDTLPGVYHRVSPGVYKATTMRSLALIALLGMTGCEAAPVYDRVHASTLTLKIGNSGCSGTAVGRYIVLTATHCVSDVPKTIHINGKACDVWKIVNDGADHALVTVGSKCPQTHTASLTIAAKAGREPKVGTRIFLFGNPYVFSDVLRFGYVAGHQDNAMADGRLAEPCEHRGTEDRRRSSGGPAYRRRCTGGAKAPPQRPMGFT